MTSNSSVRSMMPTPRPSSHADADDDVIVVDEPSATTALRDAFFKQHRSVKKGWELPSGFPSEAVVQAYARPSVDSSKEKPSWGKPDLDMLRVFCRDAFDWNRARADELLTPVLTLWEKADNQSRIDRFFAAAAPHADTRQIKRIILRPADPAAKRIGLGHAIDKKQRARRRIPAQPAKCNTLAGRVGRARIGAAKLLEACNIAYRIFYSFIRVCLNLYGSFGCFCERGGQIAGNHDQSAHRKQTFIGVLLNLFAPINGSRVPPSGRSR